MKRRQLKKMVKKMGLRFKYLHTVRGTRAWASAGYGHSAFTETSVKDSARLLRHCREFIARRDKKTT